MPIRNYNNNDKKPTVNVYSSVTFTNPESKIMQTRFSIEYFNKINPWFVIFGRYTCKAKNTLCEGCGLKEICCYKN